MGHILNLMATASTTLVAAIAAFVFQSYGASPAKFSLWECYLFLLPIPLMIFCLAMLSAHRDDIFKMGYYVKVFFEEQFGGAGWVVRLDALRHLGESQDPAILVVWSLFAVATVLFTLSLYFLRQSSYLHLLALIPFVLGMVVQHRKFMRNRESMMTAWEVVRRYEGTPNLRKQAP